MQEKNEIETVASDRNFKNENGRVGYLVAWILGIPAWLLLVIFLVRGH